MKKYTSTNKNRNAYLNTEITEFVKYHEIVGPRILSEETINKFLFIQLFAEIDLEEIFLKKIFARN